ncbi:MAG TPA: 16S rRNA (guanine(966)-N(2))-methyltransferase RsmD [Candidatus Binataceae bacterium]
MKVIAGEARGRRLRAPRGTATRPTSARVRESIFSRLEAKISIAGRTVLDLFAGSGALGIEALSRGADRAVFVDGSKLAASAIRRNLSTLDLTDRTQVIVLEAHRAMAELHRRAERFDLVFVDAPYESQATAAALRAMGELDLIASGGWVAVEMSRRETPPEVPVLERVSIATLGDHRVALYRRTESAPA